MRHLVIGTAGHIDHGKSALVRALTGTDPDRLKEERARGITIDLGFAHLEVDATSVAFVDVPGHERFVKNMLAGATGIDGVVLVVAADESVMPQTREHFDICRLLRVETGIVALTKADLVDAETIDLVALEVRELVAGSFLEGAPIVAVSSRTGRGLEELREALRALAGRLRDRDPAGPTRLAIDRVFSVRGFGSVVTGTLASGVIRVDDELELWPSGRGVKVRGLQGHGVAIDEAGPGQRVAVNLAGVEVGDIERGETLASPSTLSVTRRIDAAIEALPSARALRHGARVRFHHGTRELLGRVAVASAVGSQGGDLASAGLLAEVPPGGRAWVRLRFEAPAVLTRGDRFILRAYSPQVTIAGGVVLDPTPPRTAIRTAAGRARLSRLDPETAASRREADDAAIRQALDERGASGLALGEPTSRLGLAPAAAREAWQRVVDAGHASPAGDRLVGARVIEDLGGRLLELLAGHHRDEPQSDGLPREEARERVFAKAPAAVFEFVLKALDGSGQVTGRDRLALTTHRVAYSADEQRALAAVETAYRDGGLTPPDPAGLAAAAGLSPAQVDQALRVLVRQKTLLKIENLVFHTLALAQLRHDLAALKAVAGPGATVDVASFKQRYGLSRKYAIPLLEYLDRERVTRRVGERRVLL